MLTDFNNTSQIPAKLKFYYTSLTLKILKTKMLQISMASCCCQCSWVWDCLHYIWELTDVATERASNVPA